MGPAKLAELLVNMVLPLACLVTPERRSLLHEHYAHLPPLAENSVTKAMRALLGLEAVRLRARQQQGLIGLYKTRCAGLYCSGCALG